MRYRNKHAFVIRKLYNKNKSSKKAPPKWGFVKHFGKTTHTIGGK